MTDFNSELCWEPTPYWDELYVLRCLHPKYKDMIYRIKYLDNVSYWESILYDKETDKEIVICHGYLHDCMFKCKQDAKWVFRTGLSKRIC